MFGITDFNQAIVNFNNFDISQLGNAAIFGGAILLIGMLTIFTVLIVIWLALALFKFVFHDLAAKRENAASAKEEPVAPAPVVQVTEDTEIIAVIAAAIAMAESESSGRKFKVVSFRRK